MICRVSEPNTSIFLRATSPTSSSLEVRACCSCIIRSPSRIPPSIEGGGRAERRLTCIGLRRYGDSRHQVTHVLSQVLGVLYQSALWPSVLLIIVRSLAYQNILRRRPDKTSFPPYP